MCIICRGERERERVEGDLTKLMQNLCWIVVDNLFDLILI